MPRSAPTGMVAGCSAPALAGNRRCRPRAPGSRRQPAAVYRRGDGRRRRSVLARIRERLASRGGTGTTRNWTRTCSPKSWTAPPTAKPSGSPWSACGHSSRLRRSRPSRLPTRSSFRRCQRGHPRPRPESPRGPRHPLPGQAQAFRLGPAGGAHGAGETPPAAHVLDFRGWSWLLRKTGTFVFRRSPRLPVQGPGWAVADRPARPCAPGRSDS